MNATTPTPTPIVKRPSLLNRTHVRRFALEVSVTTGRPFNRVSGEFLDDLEESLRIMIATRVHRARSRVTLKP